MLSPEQYMQLAFILARRGLGRTWPNPAVGCVIVKNGEIIARARTANSGRPHAETEALKIAGNKAEGATIYVTLEPCAHFGKTPPCAESLLQARVAEVIIGCTDPDPRVLGKGIKFLEEAGVKVTIGLLEKQCRDLNAGFFKRIEHGLPFVTLKAAISADGKYLTGNGAPRWLTGELARNHTHLLRSQYDVIITGTGTILTDNPNLNCRLPGMEEFSPIKVVIGDTPIPKSANIFNGKETWHYKRDKLTKILTALSEKSITRALIEAGPKLSNAFLKDGLVDEIIVYQAPQQLAPSDQVFFAKNAFANFVKTNEREIGDDKIMTYSKLP